MIEEVSNVLHLAARNYYVISLIHITCILVKLFFFGICVHFIITSKRSRKAFILLSIYLVSTLLIDVQHVLELILWGILKRREEFVAFTIFHRITWIFYLTQFQALIASLEYFYTKRIMLTPTTILHGFVNIAISLSFLYLAIFKYDISSESSGTLPFESFLVSVIRYYVIFLTISTMMVIVLRFRKEKVPRILVHQSWYLIFFIFFVFSTELMSISVNSLAKVISYFKTYRALIGALGTVASTSILYFIALKIMGLRFLNIRKTVSSKEKFNFLSQFRDILEQLSYATALKELAQHTQQFFNTAFHIPIGRVRLYVRKAETDQEDHSYYDIANTTAKVEQYIGKHENETLTRSLREMKLFIRDDIHFSYFYEEDVLSGEALRFLDHINADIFVPIFERNDISAYIIVEKDARPSSLYTNKERDEMLVFTTYLSNVINILKYSNLEALHQRHKQLTEELYNKHQEINQYKESIRSFMRSKERKVGILFYKYRRFTIANEAAQILIGMDPNMNEGHPLTQAMRKVARRVQEYKTSQTNFAHDTEGNKLIITGIPSLEERSTILLVHYPEVSDVIKTHFEQLKDPSDWDYMLYLETTQSGRLINQMIPGDSEKLLNFKINLLRTALTKKATLINIPDNDLMPTVEVLHDISLRQSLHTIKLTSPEKTDEVAVTLFGLNPLIQKDAALPLLEKLDNVGTLFIQNVENLSRETQEYLAEFISFGFFHRLKSDHKVFSNVRIICSTRRNLLQLINEDKFSKELYNELEQTSLVMPSLQDLSEKEVTTLAQGYADQIITEDTYKNLLSLTDKDKTKLYDERPFSLHEFKERVHQLLVQKSSKHKISEVTKFDVAYNVSDPDIAQAVRMGKKALKDPQIMGLLWAKFKNQSKIATLLGVNRSSVNRRCQEYNLK